MKVDAHQHYWNPARGDYGWMPDNDPVLSRTYAPHDLAAELQAAGVTSTVLVQAAPSVAETEYMLGIADATPHVGGVVGWIDFEDKSQAKALQRLAKHPKFVGVRPMIQDIADVNWMLRDDIQWAFKAIIDLDLTFDALGFPRHLPNFHTLLRRYPNMRAVIDHCMKPQLRDPLPSAFADWTKGLQRIAENTNAFCKLSGIVTEADAMPDESQLRRYSDHVLGCFGPARVMWGSDWPVVRLRCEYAEWHAVAQRLTERLSAADRHSIFGGTAGKFYRLGTRS